MPKKQTENGEDDRQVPVILALASIGDWEIGPTKESTCEPGCGIDWLIRCVSASHTLTMKLAVDNYQDVKTIRALAFGQVVLRITPLQAKLPTPTDCKHPDSLQITYSDVEMVCLECGCIVPIPPDDQAKKG